MGRDLIAVVPVLVVLYGTFLLGQVNQRRKYRDRRDPLPVIAAARNVVVADQLGSGPGGIGATTTIRNLELALDAWDLSHD